MSDATPHTVRFDNPFFEAGQHRLEEKRSPFGEHWSRPQAEIDAAVAEVEAKRAALQAQPKPAPEPEDMRNIIPFAPQKSEPDAKTNPDWSAKEALIAQMNAEKTKPRNELDDALDRAPGGGPAEYPAWVKKATWWESANNVLISQGFTDSKERDAIIHATFGMNGKSMNDYRGTENDVQALKKVKDRGLLIETGNVPRPDLSKPAETQAPGTPVEAAPAIPPATPIPETAERAANTPSSPVKVASVEPETKPVMAYPESPVVVYPFEYGSVIYRGIRFSVTLRLGGTFAMALPLMEDFVKAHDGKLIELDPACLINRPATVMLPPAPAPTATAAPAPVPAAAPVAPASDGGSVRIVEVKKVQDEGKTQYHLFDAPGSDRPAFRLRIENDFNKLRPFINLDEMQIGTRYALNIIADWKPSQKVGQNGQPFRNVATIRAA